MAVDMEPIYFGTLGGFCIGFAAVLPLLTELQLLLSAQFGIGPLMLDLNLQLQAAIALQASLSVSLAVGLDLEAQLNALLSLIASLSVTVALSVNLGLSISAQLVAALTLQIGGLSLQIAAVLALELPLLAILANLSLGPLYVLPFGFGEVFNPLVSYPFSQAGQDFSEYTSNGIPPGTGPGIATTDPVIGLIMVMKAKASLAIGLGALFAIPMTPPI
jgi:hypothetical protein